MREGISDKGIPTTIREDCSTNARPEEKRGKWECHIAIQKINDDGSENTVRNGTIDAENNV
jgi:hypothetical protein